MVFRHDGTEGRVMNIIESTIAFLFRPSVDAGKLERQHQQTCRILRNITDPAEAVGECLTERTTKNDHDTAKAATRPGPTAAH